MDQPSGEYSTPENVLKSEPVLVYNNNCILRGHNNTIKKFGADPKLEVHMKGSMHSVDCSVNFPFLRGR